MVEETEIEIGTAVELAAMAPAKTAPRRLKPKRRGSAASSRPASAPKKKRGKSSGRAKKKETGWSKHPFQLVVHSSQDLQRKLDRALPRLAKMLKCKPLRGCVVRALVERAVK